MFLSVHVRPDAKNQGWRSPAGDAAHPAWSTLGRFELQVLTIRPGQGAGIRSRVGNDSIQHHSGGSTHRSEFKGEDGQRFAGIGGVIGKADAAHPTWLVFAPDAGDKG